MAGDETGGSGNWLRRNADLIAKIVLPAGIAIAGGAWVVFTYFHEPSGGADLEATGGGGVRIGDNATITSGRDTIVAGRDVVFGPTLKEYEDGLKRREAEIRAELQTQLRAGETRRQVLEVELNAVRDKLADTETAFEEQKANLEKTAKALADLRGQVPDAMIERAEEALARGATAAAEALFTEVAAASEQRAAESNYQLGLIAEDRIDYEVALEHYRKAAAIDPDSMTYQRAYGMMAWTLGRYDAAEPPLRAARRLAEAAGPETTDSALVLNELGVVVQAQGRYAEAEPLYTRSLEIKEATLGADHPEVATTLNNLGELYRGQGRYAEAKPLYKRSLEISETALGADHPSVATMLNNLAALYDARGRYAEAEPLYKRSLEISEAALGADHPEVATMLNNLAALYGGQGRDAEAEPLYKRSLEISEAALGADHPEVATTLNNLAELYAAQGRSTSAPWRSSRFGSDSGTHTSACYPRTMLDRCMRLGERPKRRR